ncbi:MAG: PepSY domain-containing protein [Shewanella sp.]
MKRLFFIGFFSLFTLVYPTIIQAGTIELEHYQAKALVNSGQILSLDSTLAVVNQYCQGELIDAHLYQEDHKWRYDLQLKVQPGQIVNLSIDATNGQPEHPTALPSECQKHETATR